MTHKAQSLGYLPEVILAGRRINDGMGKYVATEVVKLMICKEQKIFGAKVLQLGITFKENCPDIRNSHAADVARGLEEFGCAVDIFDPWANPAEVEQEYGLKSVREIPAGVKYDAIVLAVAHRKFADFDPENFRNPNTVVFEELEEANQLSGEKRTEKKKEIAVKEESIGNGTHPELKGYTSKIEKYSESLESCQQELKKMQEDEANQKELYAQSKLAQCMIGSYKQYVRNRKKAALVVFMTFAAATPEIGFKVVPLDQAGKFLGTLKEFSNPGEGEQFLTDNRAKLDALKNAILTGPLVEAPVKIQAFCEGLTDSSAA